MCSVLHMLGFPVSAHCTERCCVDSWMMGLSLWGGTYLGLGNALGITPREGEGTMWGAADWDYRAGQTGVAGAERKGSPGAGVTGSQKPGQSQTCRIFTPLCLQSRRRAFTRSRARCCLCWQAAGLCSSGALWLVDGMDTEVTTLRLYGT